MWITRRAGFLLALCIALAACGQQSSIPVDPDLPLFVEAVDQDAFTPAAGCTADVPGATYRACLNPEALYAAAVATAKDAGNPLMVVWGFEECPYCKKFAVEEMNPNRPRLSAKFVSRDLSEKQAKRLPNKGVGFQISVLHLHVRSEAGAAFAEKMGVTDIARERGRPRVWSPFVSFTRPGTDKFVAQTQFEQGEKPCFYSDDFAISLEQLGYIPADGSKTRLMCAVG